MNSITAEKLEEIFKVYDEKRVGKIPTSDVGIFDFYLAKLIRSARLFPTEQDIEELKKGVDPNRSGFFDNKKFVEIGLEFAAKQDEINHE